MFKRCSLRAVIVLITASALIVFQSVMVTVSAAAQDLDFSAIADLGKQQLMDDGRAIAEKHCLSCHAIGKADESSDQKAPTFRFLSANLAADQLQEKVAMSVVKGHAGWPGFKFQPEKSAALLEYLLSLNGEP